MRKKMKFSYFFYGWSQNARMLDIQLVLAKSCPADVVTIQCANMSDLGFKSRAMFLDHESIWAIAKLILKPHVHAWNSSDFVFDAAVILWIKERQRIFVFSTEYPAQLYFSVTSLNERSCNCFKRNRLPSWQKKGRVIFVMREKQALHTESLELWRKLFERHSRREKGRT